MGLHNDRVWRGRLITTNQNNGPRQHNYTRPLYHNEENLRRVGVRQRLLCHVGVGGGGGVGGLFVEGRGRGYTHGGFYAPQLWFH